MSFMRREEEVFFNKFCDLVGNYPCFSYDMVCAFDFKDEKRIFYRWIDRGLIQKLEYRVYVLGERFRRVPFCPRFLGSLMVKNSCLSLEYVLALHGLIEPSDIDSYTFITTANEVYKKTEYGFYKYRHVDEKYYTGFGRIEVLGNESFSMASKEKAIVDLLYVDRVKLKKKDTTLAQLLKNKYRLKTLKGFDKAVLHYYKDIYPGKLINHLVALLIAHQDED